MKQIKISALALLACIAVITVSCSKGSEIPPLQGYWSDYNNNYTLAISEDSIGYRLDEMDGFSFTAPYTKTDDNNLTFDLSENGHGTLTLNPETKDITMVLDWGENSGTYTIHAYDHFDLATTAPNIASTFLYAEDHTTVVDTLKSTDFFPTLDILNITDGYACLQLPDGRKGWIEATRINPVRSRMAPEFFEKEYALEYQNLRGYTDRIETYTFHKIDDKKIGVEFSRVYINGGAANEQYFIGELEGPHLKVTHEISYPEEWEKAAGGNVLDQPIDITIKDGIGGCYIETDKRLYIQREPAF